MWPWMLLSRALLPGDLQIVAMLAFTPLPDLFVNGRLVTQGKQTLCHYSVSLPFKVSRLLLETKEEHLQFMIMHRYSPHLDPCLGENTIDSPHSPACTVIMLMNSVDSFIQSDREAFEPATSRSKAKCSTTELRLQF